MGRGLALVVAAALASAGGFGCGSEDQGADRSVAAGAAPQTAAEAEARPTPNGERPSTSSERAPSAPRRARSETERTPAQDSSRSGNGADRPSRRARDDAGSPSSGDRRPRRRRRPATPSPTPRTVEKPAFIAAADEICDRYEAMVAEEASRAGEGRRAEARVLRRAAEVTDPMLAELRSLTPPRGDEARVSEYLAAVARTGPAYAALADAAESGSRARIRAASREARETTLAASRLAQAYGFKGCGS